MKKRPVFLIVLIIMLFFVSAVQPAFALEKWPGVTNMLNLALAAGSLLIYNTVWQVNNSVNGLVGDAHAVYEAVKEDVTPKITEWWNGLSAENQQAFTDKVQTDEDLMVSEVIPQDIITDIVSESIGYSGDHFILESKKEWNGISLTIEEFNKISDDGDGIGYALKYGIKNYTRKCTLTVKYPNESEMILTNIYMHYDDSKKQIHWIDQSWIDKCYGTVTEWKYTPNSAGIVPAYNHIISKPFEPEYFEIVGSEVIDMQEFYDNAILIIPAINNYNPDDQQSAPFYYPVNNLNMADVWDVGTASDSDLQNDQAIYDVVESGTWNPSAGVAESAIAVGLQGDVLIDNDTGLPFALGVVKPWEVSASDSATETTTDTSWTEPATKTLNFDPITSIGELLLDRFPFCVPYDFYSLMMKFSGGERIAPYWEFELGGAKAVMSLDFMDEIMVKIRTVELMVMVIAWYLYLAKHVQRS